MTDGVRLGETPSSVDRDAVHVAVIATEAGELLRPGQRVGVRDGRALSGLPILGIVDPYLTDVVQKGQKFWLCLMPNSVTGMRHHWQHPSFREQEASQEGSMEEDDFEFSCSC